MLYDPSSRSLCAPERTSSRVTRYEESAAPQREWIPSRNAERRHTHPAYTIAACGRIAAARFVRPAVRDRRPRARSMSIDSPSRRRRQQRRLGLMKWRCPARRPFLQCATDADDDISQRVIPRLPPPIDWTNASAARTATRLNARVAAAVRCDPGGVERRYIQWPFTPVWRR